VLAVLKPWRTKKETTKKEGGGNLFVVIIASHFRRRSTVDTIIHHHSLSPNPEIEPRILVQLSSSVLSLRSTQSNASAPWRNSTLGAPSSALLRSHRRACSVMQCQSVVYSILSTSSKRPVATRTARSGSPGPPAPACTYRRRLCINLKGLQLPPHPSSSSLSLGLFGSAPACRRHAEPSSHDVHEQGQPCNL
jgi:hypothetical protein